ncbi:MAG: FtsX-like permease family protein [Spirochaetia bacterium]
MLTIKLALRNLMRQKRRTVYTGLSMLVGFVLAGFFIGWADGTYNHMIDKFTRNRLGHIQVHQKGYLDTPSLYKTIDSPEEIGNRIDKYEQIEAWAPRVFSAGLVSITEKSAGAEIIGVDPQREDATTSFSNKVIEGRYLAASGEVLIGKELAKILNGGVGDEIAIFSQAADGSIAENLYTVVGLLDMGDPRLNRSGFYMSLSDARELLVLYNQAHEIALTLHDLRQVNEVTQILQAEFSDTELGVAPWQEFAKEFYRAMQADKNGMYISLLVVILVVAITILNTILMSVMERQKEYGVLKAIGTRPGSIVKMVIAETSMLALFSILIGSLITFLLNTYMAEYGLHLSSPINWGGVQLETMRGEVNLRSFVLPSLTVVMTSLTVCFFPAIKAARTEPAKTMRVF